MKKRNVFHYGRFLLVIGRLLCGMACTQALQAQSPLPSAVWVETIGNTDYYWLVLGTEQNPTEDLELLHFTVELVPDGQSAPGYFVDITDGFLNQDPNADFTVSETEDGFEFYWHSSYSGGVTGYGMVALVAVEDGGIGIIDNIDAKTRSAAGEAHTPVFKVGPVPAANVLHVASNLPFTGQAILWDTKGCMGVQLQVVKESHFEMDIAALEPGIYFLVLESDLSRFIHKVLILR